MRAAAWLLALAFSRCALALEAGAPAPDLSIPRLDDPARSVSLASLRGNVVYVDFWASWCVPCRISMPALDSLYQRNHARGFSVLGVSKDVSPVEARRFLAKVAVTFPLAIDSGDAAARAFDVKAMPSCYLVDRKGVVRSVHRGFTDASAADLEREIEALLKERS
ncbi:MAG: TlpA family protein disulfide reductase [Usitatibacter sp.]